MATSKQEANKSDKSIDFQKHFREDVLNFLHLFNLKNSFRYEDFIQLWNEMKFYQLLS